MGTHDEVLDSTFRNCRWRARRYEEIMRVPGNVADNYALSADMPPTIVFAATAARDILMPANSADIDGLVMELINASAVTTGVLTLKTSADAALTPAVSLTQLQAVTMQYIHGTGWRKRTG